MRVRASRYGGFGRLLLEALEKLGFFRLRLAIVTLSAILIRAKYLPECTKTR